MSDAGKVMIGTDGNPLRGVDGEIVLADDLYPALLTAAITSTSSWSRSANDGLDFTADSIWATNWATGVNTAKRVYWPGFSYANSATQSIHKYALTWAAASGDAIPWTRTVALKMGWTFRSKGLGIGVDDWLNPEALGLRFYYSFTVQDDPSGHEEMWERPLKGWTQLSRAYDTQTTRSGVVTLSRPPPSVLWVATFVDPITSHPEMYHVGTEYKGFDMAEDVASVSFPTLLTYNLAE